MILARLKLWAGAAFAAVLAIAGAILWGMGKGRAQQKTKSRIKDYEHAQDLSDDVARDRADRDRLRPFENRGYRD